MSGYSRLTLSLALLNMTIAHAQPGDDSVTGQPASQVPAVAKTKTLKDQNGCDLVLSTEKKTFLAPIHADETLVKDSLEDLLRNSPVRIVEKEWSPIPSKNKEIMEQKATEAAEKIAEIVFSPEYLSTDDGKMKLPDWLATRTGVLPQGLLTSLTGALNASVSETRDMEARPAYAVEGDNAIAQVTQALTSFQKQAMDVNGVANRASSIAGWSIVRTLKLNNVFKSVGSILREEFQSVNDVIARNDQALVASIAGHRKSQLELRDARLELTAIARYLQASEMILTKLSEIAHARTESANLDAQETQAITQYVLDPINTRIMFVQRDSAQVMAAYVNFAGIMDYQRNVIALMENFRGSIAFQVQTAGYGKLTMNSLQQSMTKMRTAQNAADNLLKATLEQMKTVGVQIREFPEFMFESQEKTLDVVQYMINEVQVMRESLVLNDQKSKERIAHFGERLNEMRQKSGVVDYIDVADKFIDQTQGQKSKDLKLLPPPQKYPAQLVPAT